MKNDAILVVNGQTSSGLAQSHEGAYKIADAMLEARKGGAV